MNKKEKKNEEEKVCENCKHHYIEDISFNYPQSCCSKRKAIIEKWFNCEYYEEQDKENK